MDIKTLKKIRQKESNIKVGLSELPMHFYEDCREALDYSFKSNNYREFQDIQSLVQNIHEIRQGKLLNYAIYRSVNSRLIESNPIENILKDEEELLNSFLSALAKNNEDIDLLLDGYYFQEVRL